MRDFAYARPASLADAAAAFTGGGEAAYIAGGHTLLPAIKSRLRMPDTLVDLGAIPSLTGVTESDGRLWIGAMTTHAAVAGDAVLRAVAQLPPPDDAPIFRADARDDTGNSLADRFGRMFGRGKWKREE